MFRACGKFLFVILTVEIPDELVREARVSPSALRLEVQRDAAVGLYARGHISLGKATEFAEMTRQDFEELLASRKVERPYDVEELERDLAWAKDQVK